MIYLYGLLAPEATPDATELAGLSGVTGPVSVMAAPAGHLIFGEAETAEMLPRRRHMLAHTRVLELCMAWGPLLPMRFGMVVDGADQILPLLEEDLAALKEQFALVAGHAEFGLKISFPRQVALEATLSAEPDLASERRDLLAMSRPPQMRAAEFGRRLAEALDRRRGRVQKALASILGRECRAHALAAPEQDVQVLHLHALIRPARAQALAERALSEAIASGFAPGADPEVRLVGPVPAFNFAQIALGGGRSVAA